MIWKGKAIDRYDLHGAMQTSLRTLVTLVAFLPLWLGVAACKKEFPLISPDECPKLVEHSKALLGEGVADNA